MMHSSNCLENCISRPSSWALLFVGSMFLLAVLTFAVSPMNGEDYALTRQFSGENIAERLGWVLDRSSHQVMAWNARFGEQLAIFWLSMPALWFTVANTLTLAAFVIILALFATPQSDWNSETLSLCCFWVLVTCYLFWPRLEVFFWRTTAAGYLQPLVITLFLVLPFYSSRACRALLIKKTVTCFFVILGLLAGFSFENVPPALLPFMVIMLVANFRQRSEFSVSLSLILTAYLVGWLSLMWMPSTQTRTAWYVNAYALPEPSLTYYFERGLAVVNAFYGSSAKLLFLVAALAFLGGVTKRAFLHQRKPLLLLLIPASLCVASLIKAPYIEPRALSLAWCVLCIFAASLMNDLFSGFSDYVKGFIVFVSGLTSLAVAVHAFQIYLDYSRKVEMRAEYIAASQTSETCNQGLDFQLVSAAMEPRIINNREDWVQNNLPHMSRYFNCALRLNSNIK